MVKLTEEDFAEVNAKVDETMKQIVGRHLQTRDDIVFAKQYYFYERIVEEITKYMTAAAVDPKKYLDSCEVKFKRMMGEMRRLGQMRKAIQKISTDIKQDIEINGTKPN